MELSAGLSKYTWAIRPTTLGPLRIELAFLTGMLVRRKSQKLIGANDARARKKWHVLQLKIVSPRFQADSH